MSANLHIESQTAKHAKCLAILEMISRNQSYMLDDIRDSKCLMFQALHGMEYYRVRVAFRRRVHARLVNYYAKNVAAMASEAYEVSLAIREPKQSPIQSL